MSAGCHILIVDDSPTDRGLLVDLLSRRGWRVSEARNADEALHLARTLRPEAVLMDVVMPGSSGFEATRRLRAEPSTRDIPVILCTCKNPPSDRVWGSRQGARGHLGKPIRESELLAVLTRVLPHA